ncbi:MAG: DUF1289 domain-containing protein [Hahellaceae bacterium]|nr:DUF1289 domain-containing protein [Hahellaceae bacterium]
MKVEQKRVKSPCINVCALDEHDVCTGCHRHADEIAVWSSLSDDEKLEVLKRVAERERKHIIGRE